MNQQHRQSHNNECWNSFLGGFDAFTFLRMAHAMRSERSAAEFTEVYPGQSYEDGHVAVALHFFRMLAAESLFLVLLQTGSGRNILDFMRWFRGDRMKSALECVAARNLPPDWSERHFEDYFYWSLTLDHPLVGGEGEALPLPDPKSLAEFISSEAGAYLKNQPFNSMKHGGRFSTGFPTLSVEASPGKWTKVLSAPAGITAFTYTEKDLVGTLETHSLALDVENDLERLRGTTSLLDISTQVRATIIGRPRGNGSAWFYPLTEETFRPSMNFRRNFGFAS